MTDSTETRPGQAEALSVAGQAVMEVGEFLSWSEADDYGEAAVRAAYPIIAAAVREQVARDIETDAEGRERDGLYLIPWAMRDAAKIARGVRA